MKPETNAFLRRFHSLLKEAYWGDIDPYWFDPDYLILEEGEEPSEEYLAAKDLQERVEKALEGE